MRSWLLLIGLVSLASIPVLASENGACDMKTVEKMRYCEVDDLILDKGDLVSDHKYFECASCGTAHDKGGTCPDCEDALQPKVSGKNACKHCFGPTLEVDVCVKKEWRCPDCDQPHAKSGTCADCEVKLVESVSRALIVYECEECGTQAYVAGKCATEDCEAKGKPLAKRCTGSGEFPHGGSSE